MEYNEILLEYLKQNCCCVCSGCKQSLIEFEYVFDYPQFNTTSTEHNLSPNLLKEYFKKDKENAIRRVDIYYGCKNDPMKRTHLLERNFSCSEVK